MFPASQNWRSEVELGHTLLRRRVLGGLSATHLGRVGWYIEKSVGDICNLADDKVKYDCKVSKGK